MKQLTYFPRKSKFSKLLLFFASTFVYSQATDLLVIDSDYSKKEQLLSQVFEVQILYLDSETNPWTDIREVLLAEKSIKTVHLFTDATYKEIRMGGITYNIDTLNDEFELGMLEGLYQGTNIQLLIYNCNLGSNADGLSLIKKISDLSYFNVAAPTKCNSVFTPGLEFDYTAMDLPVNSSILK
ncbi:DUF4347 domain-containing protein [Maribacter algicola]|uniref:DUF4347 domain-containing protein n=1 Tax=Meishania litoralis TaxID=3434685 RepID=A0ACC7LPS2_9FLAO